MKKYFVSRIIPGLRKTKNYALIAGAILFLLGLLGFAFRSDNSLPDMYLAGALVLGFWGIVSGLWEGWGNGDSENISQTAPTRPTAVGPNDPSEA